MADRAIVTLDVRVLLWLAWLDEFNADTARLSPYLEQPTDIFRAVIDTNDLWCAASFDELVQAAHHTHGWQREVYFDAQTLSIEVV